MSASQEVIVLARLAGTRQFLADNQKLIMSQGELALSTETVGRAMKRTADRTWLMNQAMFTLRRYVYYGTLALTGLAAAALKMGFDFNNAMQTATVALRPFFDTTEQLNGALNRLWIIAKYTPFQIKDMTLAFRALFPSFQALGISSDQTIDTIQALIDALSVAGKVSGPALNRVTVALQHMAFQGRLTGLSVNQLARDGIPIFAILRKELGLTADQMHHVGQLGIPASVAIQAIIHYMRTTPGYADAAMRQSRMTLTGLFSTFKDNISRMFGMLENDAFGRMQGRISALDDWFNRFFDHFTGRSVSVRQVLVYAFGRGAGMIWDQLAADLKLVLSIFTQLVKDVGQSKAVWATLYLALLTLRPILYAINFFLQHFGWLLYILIPLIITWTTVTIAATIAEKNKVFWDALATKRLGEMTLAQFIVNRALFAYYLVLGRVILVMKALPGLWSVLTTGMARNERGQFRVLTTAEKLVLRMRWAALAAGRLAWTLVTTLVPSWEAVTVAAAAAWEAMGGPVFWIITAIILLVATLVVLYFRWKAFHDLVNKTVQFLWDHPLVMWFIPVIGPLLTIVALLVKAAHYWHRIAGFFGRVGGFLGGVVGLQEGGTLRHPGWTMVGERGPELLLLPGGASVVPLPTTTRNANQFFGPQAAHETGAPRQVFRAGQNYMQDWGDRPLVIQLMLGRKVLEEVTVDRMAARQARA